MCGRRPVCNLTALGLNCWFAGAQRIAFWSAPLAPPEGDPFQWCLLRADSSTSCKVVNCVKLRGAGCH